MAETRAYFDYAATTPIDPRVAEGLHADMAEALNPSSTHQPGQRARRLLEDARERLAALIEAQPGDIVFTSGATEAANLALRGLADAPGEMLRAASSGIEHSCVHHTLRALAQSGRARIESFPVGENGRAQIRDSAPALDMICVMHSNNETGVLQDIAAVRQRRESAGGLWLCDASQSLGKVPVSLEEIGADLLILSAHKVYGPVGIGCLAGPAVHRLVPQITGGHQENERRAGTPAVALARAFVHAAELAEARREQASARLRSLEQRLLTGLADRGIAFERNGAGEILPGFLNLSFRGFDGADLAIALDQRGIDVSPGAACSTGVVSVSPVLEAMFPLDRERAAAGLRITMGRHSTDAEVDRLLSALESLVPSRPRETH